VDGRKDVFEIEDEQLLENVNCTALICRENNLIMERGVSTLRVKNYGESFNLCTSEPFRQQPVLSGSLCTGFLVKEDIIATAAHYANHKNVKDLRVVFGYKMLNSREAVEEIPEENIYKGVEIIGRDYIGKNAEPDWALVKLDRKVKGQTVAVLSKDDIFYGQQVYVIGYPLGLPVKLAPGAQVSDFSETCFAATLDIYMGNSGSPVFCSETHEAIGMVVRGDTRDFRWTGKGWRSIVYPNLRQMTMGPQCTRVSEFIAVVDKL
jgi:S1-C subfamily serine protease